MTDATTGQGAEGAGGARRENKETGPAGRAYAAGGQSGTPQSDRSTGPRGEEHAPLVAGHEGDGASSAGQGERADKDKDKGDGSRSPLVAGPAGHEAAAQGEGARREGPHRGRLLPHDECDKLSLRLQHAVAGFVDGPRNAVEEADHVMEEVAARVTDALTQRRRTLRHSWQQDGEDKHANAGDTEQLRLALRDYRELADRLLHL
ncbi:hypothetical protein [Streptomyces sp. S.PB5]|uniref:hypothetical protein n=1 Tax=Streptomyces sp. S.PB5 TaxID=3020844 RepID=UPI0025B1D0E7|nr:hypothetical protein [Streptomyces sp. S.PB5]MDN3020534.1 hypothetical protein [Streptomyces sp. S.PB5]